MNPRPTYRKTVTNAEVERAVEPHVSALRNYVVKGGQITKKDDLTDTKRSNKQGLSENENATEGNLSPEMHDYLISIFEHPYLSTVARSEYLGQSAYKANQLKKASIDQGCVFELPLNLGQKFGGIIKLARLTESGYQALYKPIPSKPKFPMGPVHAFWEEFFADRWRNKGETVRIEYELNGKRADVVLIKKSGLVAIEIETTPKNIVANVSLDLKAGFTRVIVACTSHKIRNIAVEKLSVVLDEKNMAKVKVMAVSEFSFVRDLRGRAPKRKDKRGTSPLDAGHVTSEKR